MLSVEVIVSTYNNPSALQLTLQALSCQDRRDFMICIADDGSAQATKQVADDWISKLGEGRVRHVWHPDEGFQKNRILNCAIASSSADYLIFLDGDCVAQPHFVSRHLEARRAGRFCTGGVVRLSTDATAEVTLENIQSTEVFGRPWLLGHQAISGWSSKLKAGLVNGALARFLERISPVKRTWNGGNSSGWRADLLAVNGFDESLSYGSEDVELGFRLNNEGVQGRHVRYTAIALHLEHSRGYADPAKRKANRANAVRSLKEGKRYTPNGIVKG